MKNGLKKNIGDIAIHLGKNAVGRCMFPGMFDPKIPDILKDNKEKNQVGNNMKVPK